MPTNVEIKARVADMPTLARRAAEWCGQAPTLLVQDDTFFACAQGRLKLRVFGDGSAELIAYQRADTAGPKTSRYERTPVTTSDLLRATLAAACGVLGRVQKRRQLLLAGRTRIHLDEVQGLGSFMELEVMLAEGEAPEAGVAEAHRLMAQLGILPTALVEGAYLDLLAAREAPDG